MSALGVLAGAWLAAAPADEPCHVVTNTKILSCEASPDSIRAASRPRPGGRTEAPPARQPGPPDPAPTGTGRGPEDEEPAVPAPRGRQDEQATQREEERARAAEEAARAEAQRQAAIEELSAIREELAASRARAEEEAAERQRIRSELRRTAAELRTADALLATGSVSDAGPYLERAERTFDEAGQPAASAAIASARAALEVSNLTIARVWMARAAAAAGLAPSP